MVVSLQSSSNEVLNREPEVINKAKHNFKTKIGNKYSAKDVIKVWDCISKWIENNMNQEKGILIKGIGYFTFAKWMINVGKGYPYTVRKPVFVVDAKLAKDFNLKKIRPYNTGNIYERYLNLSSVAQNFQLNINMVTHCFKEVVTAFRRLLYEKKNCELPFSKIGKLQIKNKMITMKFYQEFLERQNQNLKDRTEEEKRNYQSTSYNPDWDADQYENQKRPCSAMSIINRPASSLSQYRPGTGYNGVLPEINETATRPDSRLSLQSRPDSRLSVQSRPDSRISVQSRPNSRLSVQSRPDSRLSVQSRPDSRLSLQSRPDSRLSVQSRPDSSLSVQSRPDSRLSAQSRPGSCQSTRSRPGSGLAMPSDVRTRSRSGSSAGPNVTNRPESRPLSRSGRDRDRPKSNMSDRRRRNRPPSGLEATRDNSPATAPGPSDGCSDTKSGAMSKNDATAADQNDKTENHYDENLCCSCNIRKLRFVRTDAHKLNSSPADNKDNFMKGDNLLNILINSVQDIENNRKNRTKEISNYNYVTANELCDTVNKEKTKIRSERNGGNCILIKRPTSVVSNRSEKRTHTSNLLLDQIERNAIKTKKGKIVSLKDEKLIQEEMLKNLHEERMKNIEAKARSKENYLTILNEHMKSKTTEKMRKENDTVTIPNIILGTDDGRSQSCAKLNKYKNLELANYQLKQHTARNLASQEEKEKSIDYERNLLNRLKEQDETLRKKMLQKKLNQKKFLMDDLNKFLAMAKTERRKNEIPKAYPMTFPLQKMGKRCRLCKKNGLRFPIEKITSLQC